MKLSRVNTLLLIAIILINGVTFVTPFLPGLLFRVDTLNTTKRQQFETTLINPPQEKPNSLIMPTLAFDEHVYDGPDARTLRKGIWRRPMTNTPDQGGNTVLAAHRFTYSNPRGTFYNLDKLKLGDEIGLVWKGRAYTYNVAQIKTVGPNDISIEAPTANSQLTLYTCTPLALPKDRLVVVATLKEPTHE